MSAARGARTMPALEGHHRHPNPAAARSQRREARLRFALVANVAIVAAQVTVGLAARSLGLLSDAGHNLTDVVAVVLSLVAVRLARRAPTDTHSFGFHRSTILAAQANAALILALTVGITVEAVRRLLDPPDVAGGPVLVVAVMAFAANAAAAAAVHEHDGHDLNMRSALLHLVSDAAASAGVALAGAVMLVTGGWDWLDPAVSLAIAASIAWHAVVLLRSSNTVLLEGTPTDLSLDDLHAEMTAVAGVEAVHDLHVWSLSSELRALSAHVVVEGQPSLAEAQAVAGRVRATLADRFAIAHSTLELECEGCVDSGCAGLEPPA